MPRGRNPNSLANLTKGKPFNADSAREANKKSVETRKWNSNLKAHLKSLMNDETLDKINGQLVQQCEEGNLNAIKMIYEYIGTDTIADEDGTGVVVLPEVNDE